ncbi:uncharacterized protein CC84DRAFT_1163310 [Paraphaeosphaeria sporulosa]|uniref:Uncharacterized protein n=1 Tax=Paraphaeosphaeria sporulosa TaxID=1460663 RepID=A0A177CJA8_9PLEO|nr:uncharacterized protein CC84DRAFT_1163310 [Paraphaeosphaeria sporulosa]OAG07062.1 hypothetical protein CC84DRAFT_1163310 [Paraphaeosphaeria sporulosa]
MDTSVGNLSREHTKGAANPKHRIRPRIVLAYDSVRRKQPVRRRCASRMLTGGAIHRMFRRVGLEKAMLWAAIETRDPEPWESPWAVSGGCDCHDSCVNYYLHRTVQYAQRKWWLGGETVPADFALEDQTRHSRNSRCSRQITWIVECHPSIYDSFLRLLLRHRQLMLQVTGPRIDGKCRVVGLEHNALLEKIILQILRDSMKQRRQVAVLC